MTSLPLVKTTPGLVMDVSLAPDGEGLLAVSFDFGVAEGTMRLFAEKKELVAFYNGKKLLVPPVPGQGRAGSDFPPGSDFPS